jgi:DNA-binding transcriptional MocR family regulator
MATHLAPHSLTHLTPMTADASQRLVMQVARHVEQMLQGGQIEPGGRLPSERTVALDLGVSRNTATAAYDELEQRGLIRRIRGKGSFMCSPRREGESFSWSGKISASAHLLDEPVLDMLARNGDAGMPHPLSAGTPSLDCFPTADYHACINKIIANDFPRALAVAATEGQQRLRRSIGKWMKVEANHVFITSGAQEGIDLLARCLIEPGDVAIVESPTYPGAIQCLRAAGAKLIGWETDWSLEKLEQLIIRYRPKVIFTMPTFQNPTGRVMPLTTRRGLLDLASRYHVPIVEDDVYSKTYLNGRAAPDSLLKLDKQSLVIYMSTFSKMLAPGLRLGWIVAPFYMVKQLSLVKMRANLFTDGLTQLAVSELMESGGLDRHLDRLRQHHGVLRDAAVAAAQQGVEAGLLSFLTPSGGLYLWCKVPPTVDLDLLLATAERRGLTFAPGHAFFLDKVPGKYLRLCYTAAGEARVKGGVSLLTRILREHDAEAATASAAEAALDVMA